MAAAASTRNTSRRRFLADLAATPALAVPAIASAAQGDDAELLALEAEIFRLEGLRHDIQATRVNPHEKEYDRLLGKPVTHESYKAAWKFSDEVGRSAAIKEVDGLLDRGFRLYDRMREIPARTQAGRQAKVRALIVHVLGDEWRGTTTEIDCAEKEFTRELLGEFSGLTEAELAAI
jgi:hypothetical protein